MDTSYTKQAESSYARNPEAVAMAARADQERIANLVALATMDYSNSDSRRMQIRAAALEKAAELLGI